MSVNQVFEKLRSALDNANVPYLVTGSFVSSLHGIPRSTNDIDVVIAPTRAQLLALVEQFPEADYYCEKEDALQALTHRSQFNVIDQNSLWKIDFIVSRQRPFDVARFRRRAIVELAGVRVHAATPEDVLIAKLDWAKEGGSERQIEDAAGVVRVQGASLDVSYIEEWVEALQLQDEWARARAKAKPAQPPAY